MVVPTFENFRDCVVDTVNRAGIATTRRIVDSTWEIRTYVKLAYGDSEGTRLLNQWVDELLVPLYPDQEPSPTFQWRLKDRWDKTLDRKNGTTHTVFGNS